MLKRLYIIGNGFDLHHGIPSSYRDYRKWLEKNDRGLLERLREYYDVDSEEWWGDFEEALGHSSMGSYIEITSLINQPRFDDYEDVQPDEYLAGEFQAREEIGGLVNSIKETFRQWIKDFPKPKDDFKIELNSENAFFINFNYTDTLQSLYNVDHRFVWYIHGEARSGEKLIFGHNRSHEELKDDYCPPIPEPPDDCGDIERWFEKANDGEDYIHQTVREEAAAQIYNLNKGTDSIIHNDYIIFEGLRNVQEVYSYGLSFSPVDLPYLNEIVKHVPKGTATWTVSYYSADDLTREKDYFKAKGLSQINYIKLEDLKLVRQLILDFD
jgi:hypothetical protein